jgi:hypothetical protein
MNAIVSGLSLAASLIFGVLTVIFILSGLRQLYKPGGGGARGILFITLLSLVTGALVLVQLVGVVSQIAPN